MCFFRKNFVMVPVPFLWTDFDINLHIFLKCNETWDMCMFQHCRSKVKVTDPVLRMDVALFSELILIYLYTNVSLTISWKNSHFSIVGPRSRSQLHMAGTFITFSNCLV